MENGTNKDKNKNTNDFGSDKSKTETNTLMLGHTLKMLKEKTGKDKFTLDELYNPNETLKKYAKNTKGNSKKK